MLRGRHPNPPQGHSVRRNPVHRGPGLLLGEPDPGPRRSRALDASSGPLGGPSIPHRTPYPSRVALAGAAPLPSNAQGDHSRDDRWSLLGDDGPALVASPIPSVLPASHTCRYASAAVASTMRRRLRDRLSSTVSLERHAVGLRRGPAWT